MRLQPRITKVAASIHMRLQPRITRVAASIHMRLQPRITWVAACEELEQRVAPRHAGIEPGLGLGLGVRGWVKG